MKVASFETREWIDPEKDRRPMTEDWVLVSFEDDGHRYVTINRYDPEYGWEVDADATVEAWMPLPDAFYPEAM